MILLGRTLRFIQKDISFFLTRFRPIKSVPMSHKVFKPFHLWSSHIPLSSKSVVENPSIDTQTIWVRFQVRTAASMKMTVFWDVASWCVVDGFRRFRGGCWVHHQGNAKSTSKTSIIFYQTTRCNIPEDSHLQTDYIF
jgi:hypothetical protein